MNALYRLLSHAIDPQPIPDLATFWARFDPPPSATPFERALLGGLAADRLGYAFAAGYQAALRALVPELPTTAKACLVATEEGGAHPAAIATRLDASADGTLRLNGKKRWASVPDPSTLLLVIARDGLDSLGRPRLRVAKVASDAPGVRLVAMPPTPFMPEIAHCQVELDDVAVLPADVLPGDGYAAILKPFRTIEDLHVHAAALAYLVREARLHALDPALIERAAVLLAALESLARMNAGAPETHIALAGILALHQELLPIFEAAWAPHDPAAHQRFVRDRPLFGVAQAARTKRRERAWERLGEP